MTNSLPEASVSSTKTFTGSHHTTSSVVTVGGDSVSAVSMEVTEVDTFFEDDARKYTRAGGKVNRQDFLIGRM